MNLFRNMAVSGSALTANRLRMDVISSNIANAQTTRSKFVDGKWLPYQRKMVSMEPAANNQFSSFLDRAMGRNTESQGVRVKRIVEDRTEFRRVHDPSHPEADENGFVYLPNVDVLKEMVDLMSATRSYEANVTTLNATKAMYMKALEIGK